MSAALRIVQEVSEYVATPSEKKLEAFGFEDAWALYPKKQARKDAMKAWGQVVTPGEVVSILVAIHEWRRVWNQRDLQYVPLFASWIRGERWMDELPPEYRQSHQSHAPVRERVETERVEMPESVRAAIAKLRKG